MFSFDVRELFQRKIIELLLTLVIIHISTFVLTFLVGWFYPYLKTYLMKAKKVKAENLSKQSYKSQLTNDWENDEKTEFINNLRGGCMDGYNSKLFHSLKKFIHPDLPKTTPDALDSECDKYTSSLNNLIFGIDETVKLRRIFRHGGKKCSSKTQRNVSSNNKNLQDILPELILSHIPSDMSVMSGKYFDQFEFSSSDSSEYNDAECEYLPFYHNASVNDNLNPINKESNVTTATFESTNLYSKIQHVRSLKSISWPITASLGSKEYKRQASFENKNLEMSILEFEKELKSIRDQIRVLKDCFGDFENIFSSDVSSSIHSTLGVSEDFSQLISSSLSSDLYGTLSMPFTMNLKKPCESIKDRLEPNSKLEFITEAHTLPSKNKGFTDINCNNAHNLSSQYNKETKKCKKRSPLADMYVRLSHFNSQPHFVMNSKYSNRGNCTNIKPLSFCINLNLNLRATAVSSNLEIKKQNISPLLSGPEDLLNKTLKKCFETGKTHY